MHGSLGILYQAIHESYKSCEYVITLQLLYYYYCYCNRCYYHYCAGPSKHNCIYIFSFCILDEMYILIKYPKYEFF